jgi:hypothetical protein
MGDRAVVGFKADAESPVIYLYSHWAGSDMDFLLAQALEKAEPRWSDSDYATRIVISHLISDDWKSLTGWGISVNTFAYPDYQTIKVVEWSEGIVSERLTDSPDTVIHTDTFADFVSAKQTV